MNGLSHSDRESGLPSSGYYLRSQCSGCSTGIEEHNNYAVDFIQAAGWIRRNLPGAHVSGGVSNLSFSFRGNNYIREAMHAVFLYHAIREGMDMGIVNPASSVLYTDIPADILERIEDVVLNRRPDAAERLIETAERLKAEKRRYVRTDFCYVSLVLAGRNDGGRTFAICFGKRNRRLFG